MTILIGDNSPRVSYSVAEGVTQTSFTVPFEFFDDADLNVYVDDVLKTLTTDYTVTGGDGSTGSITISVTGASGGSTVVITRDIALERTTDFPPTGPFQVASLNRELDRIVAIAADLEDSTNRGLRLSDSDTTSTLVLAPKNTRKGTVLAFNATTGDVEVGPTIADTQSIADVTADIATLADIEDGTTATNAIQTVASISSNVTTVAGVSANVTTVAGQTTNMQNITDNLTAVQNAATNATNAASSASAAATSATNAATSEANASTSETNAATSATSAASSASTASTAATNASNSASTASTAATNAATSETNAATSETNAATSATAAASSASSASTSASAASTSATNAATSETNAATSASAAAASQAAAATSAASAASAYDTFDDRYLGSKASDPTVDNDGNPLVSGALYFNSTENEMRVYDGANWIAASSAGGASLLNYNYTATSGQTTFSGADDNSATLSYTQQNLIVTLNGVVLEDGTDYTANNGTSIVLSVGATAGDELNVIAFKPFTTADMVPASTGGTFSGNVVVNGDLTVDTDTLYVDSTNNRIGLGTTAPVSKVDVVHTGDTRMLISEEATNTSTLATVNTANTAYSDLNIYSNNLKLSTSGAERMRIDSSGNVLVGTTGNTTGGKVHVTSSTSTGLGIYNPANNGYACLYVRTDGTGNYLAYWNYQGSAVGSITTNGSSAFYNTTSDYRLKENVTGITDGIERVKQLNPSRFNFIADADKTVDGFLAHEVQSIVPEAITGEKDAVDEDGNPEYQGIDQSKLVPLLTAALQEAIAKIETLEARVAALENA